MIVRIFLLIHFSCLILSTNENEFVLVSTTPKTPNSPTVEQKLISMEQTINQLQQKFLESKTADSVEQKLSTVEEKINQLRLQILELKTEQKAEEKFNAILLKLQEFELENNGNFKIPEKMSSSFSQLANYQTSNPVFPRNCKEVQERGHNVSRVYLIKPDLSPKTVAVLCDMKKRGGGWTYILNRFDGSQEFHSKKWAEYKNGFGSVSGEFWLGLDNIHYLTGYEMNELLVELVDWDDKKVYAHYEKFSVGSESEGFSLKILKGYEGTAGDKLSYAVSMKFSSKDNDQDASEGNCADKYEAGWWFRNCMMSFLTGKYYKENVANISSGTGMHWNSFHSNIYSLKQARMLVRPQNIDFLPHEEIN